MSNYKFITLLLRMPPGQFDGGANKSGRHDGEHHSPDDRSDHPVRWWWVLLRGPLRWWRARHDPGYRSHRPADPRRMTDSTIRESQSRICPIVGVLLGPSDGAQPILAAQYPDLIGRRKVGRRIVEAAQANFDFVIRIIRPEHRRPAAWAEMPTVGRLHPVSRIAQNLHLAAIPHREGGVGFASIRLMLRRLCNPS